MSFNPVDHEIQRASAEELQVAQDTNLVRFLIDHVWDNAYYADRYSKAHISMSDLITAREIKRLPIMRKADVLSDIAEHPPFGRRCNASRDDIRQIVETSGTTSGVRERYPLTSEDVASVIRMEAFGFHWAGVRQGSVVASCLPVTTRAGGQWYQDAVRSLGGIYLALGNYSTEKKFGYLRDFGADLLVASPSYLMRLEIVADELGIDPASLKVGGLMTAGEPFSVAWACERERVWQAKLYEQYGSTQRAIAWSCEYGATHDGGAGTLHFLPHLAVYEIIDPVTGDEVEVGHPGELVITPFCSGAAPLVRFATGDRVIKVAPGVCPCGRLLPGIVAGRVDRYDSMIKVRGVNLFQSSADEVILRRPVIEYKGRVYIDESSGREEIEVTVEASPESPLGTEGIEDLRRRLLDEFGLRFAIVPHHGPSLTSEIGEDAAKRQRWVDERHRSGL